MTPKAEEYLKVYSDIGLRITDEETWYEKLDKLWYSLDDKEVDWVEERLKSLESPDAPEFLNLVDQKVELGESLPPRIPS